MHKLFVLTALFPFLLVACSQDDKPESKPQGKAQGSESVDPQASNVLLVTDVTGKPISGAQILIGMAQGDPFKANFLTTDVNGKLPIPAAWTTAQPVTIQADGFVRLTEFARQPAGATFVLHKINQVPTVELSGVAQNLPIKDNDGQIDFGLVMSALSRNDILGFDISKVVSLQTDSFSIAGQTVNVPSNISLPKQKETYFFFGLTINKPNYRLYFPDLGPAKVFAARGRVPLNALVSAGNSPVYDLINSFKISGGSVQDVTLTTGTNVQNFVMTDLNFTASAAFTAPNFSSDQTVVALAAADLNGSLIPTDVKNVPAGQTMNLALHPTANPVAIGVLKNSSEFTGDAGVDRVSAVILPFGKGVQPQFLSLIDDPTFDGGTHLSFQQPADLSGVSELATLSVLSEVRSVTMGSATVPLLIHQWEVYAPQWVSSMDLPLWPGILPQAAKKRWEVTYLGSQLKSQVDLGQAVIDAATHITHSSVDF